MSVLLGNGNGTFKERVDYATGNSPRPIVMGDFNADGNEDLAVGNLGDRSVSVLLGNGDGTFQMLATYEGVIASSVAVGDFNGDGKPDLAVDNLSVVSVLLGNGDGTFQTPVGYAIGSYAESVAVGDFDGDGKADLAVTNFGDNSVSVLLGNGDGTFQTHAEYAQGQAYGAVTVVDFNGDAAVDLAFLNFDSSLSILMNIRGTGIDPRSSQSPSIPGQSVTLTATVGASMNGAGITTPSGSVTFLDGTEELGSGTLSGEGVASFSTATLKAGTHSITVLYQGDDNFNPHTVGLVQVVNGPDFAINATPGSATLKSGSSATFSVAVSPMYGFNGSVSLNCSVSPTPALAPTCSLNPTSVTPTASGSATSNLTVATTGSTAALSPIRLKSDWRPFYALSLPVLGLALLGAGFGTRGPSTKKFVLGILVINLLALGLASQMACGGASSSKASGTPPGQYTVTMNAISGSVTHTTKVTLTVQ